jgi:hypothetical protein
LLAFAIAQPEFEICRAQSYRVAGLSSNSFVALQPRSPLRSILFNAEAGRRGESKEKYESSTIIDGLPREHRVPS